MEKAKLLSLPKSGGFHPVEYYQKVRLKTDGQKVVYINGPITSGPAAQNQEWSVSDRIHHNQAFALSLIDSLASASLLPKGVIISAHTLEQQNKRNPEGGLTPWTESDYLCLWIAIMAGLDGSNDMKTLHDAIHDPRNVDTKTLNDHHADLYKRKEQYARLTTIALACLHEFSKKPIISMLSIPGAENSLGSTVEKNVSQALRVPQNRISIDANKSISAHEPFTETALFAWLLTQPQLLAEFCKPGKLPVTVHPVSPGN